MGTKQKIEKVQENVSWLGDMLQVLQTRVGHQDTETHKISTSLSRLDRKISRVQRLVAQLRFPECIVIWERNLLVVKEENLHASPKRALESFVNYITIQEITMVAEGDWKIIVV